METDDLDMLADIETAIGTCLEAIRVAGLQSATTAFDEAYEIVLARLHEARDEAAYFKPQIREQMLEQGVATRARQADHAAEIDFADMVRAFR